MLAYAIQIPVDQLVGVPSFPTVGVYASVSRPRVTVRTNSGVPAGAGGFVQVNRMGNPLFNEALVALKDKDRYNGTSPTGDAQFATYALNPELASLLNVVFGTNFQTTNRTDLAAIFIPDVLRVDTSTGPVRLAGQPGFNRLSLFGGDVTASGVPSGWPNGRRFGDDVVDIALTALASGPTYTPLVTLGDNINANDVLYNQVFPYSATPHAGPTNRKDPPLIAPPANTPTDTPAPTNTPAPTQTPTLVPTATPADTPTPTPMPTNTPLSLCGNGRIDPGERCEPPGTLCTNCDTLGCFSSICSPTCMCERLP